MKSAILDVLNGNFGNHEFLNTANQDKESLEEVINCEQKLTEFLKAHEEMSEIFKRYVDAEGKRTCIEVDAFYKAGFRDGFRLALDAMDEE